VNISIATLGNFWVVLVGSETYLRPMGTYEILKAQEGQQLAGSSHNGLIRRKRQRTKSDGPKHLGVPGDERSQRAGLRQRWGENVNGEWAGVL